MTNLFHLKTYLTRFLRLLPALLFFFLSAYLLFLDKKSEHLPPFPHFDKLVHLVLFFLLTLNFAFAIKQLTKRRLQFICIFLCFWALFTELYQGIFLIYRTGTTLDVLADLTGITLGVYCMISFSKIKFRLVGK